MIPKIRCRVVCALDVIMDKRSHTQAFIKVDLPTLGFPTIETKPDLCFSIYFKQMYIVPKKYVVC